MERALKNIKGHKIAVLLVKISCIIKRYTGIETQIYKAAWTAYSEHLQTLLDRR